MVNEGSTTFKGTITAIDNDILIAAGDLDAYVIESVWISVDTVGELTRLEIDGVPIAGPGAPELLDSGGPFIRKSAEVLRVNKTVGGVNTSSYSVTVTKLGRSAGPQHAG